MSNDLLHVGSQLYVSRKLLLKSGVKADTVKGWKTSARIKRERLPDGTYFCYETLPPGARAALPFAGLGAARQAARQAEQQQAAEAASRQAWGLAATLAAYIEVNWPKYAPEYPYLLGLTNAAEASREAESYGRLHAGLEWCANGEHEQPLAKLLPVFQEQSLRFCPGIREATTGPGGAYVSFSRKLKQYRQAATVREQAAGLVHRYRQESYRPQNARKVQADHTRWLVKFYGNPVKPTAVEAWEEYNRVAAERRWPALSERTVNNVLKDTEREWKEARDGVKAFKAKFGYTYTLTPASFADALLQFDGTVEPFVFHDELGKKVGNLYSIRVWDMYSGCIVGSAYGTTENADLVLAALRDYLTRWRRRPYEFRHDKGAANMSEAVQTLMNATGAVHRPGQPGRPKGRRSEKLLGQFQNQVQRKVDLWRGPNITSNRNETLQANPERLAAALKTHRSYAEAEALARQCEEEWNNRPAAGRSKDRRSPLEKYTAACEQRQLFSLADLARILLVKRERPVRYASHGLKVEVNNVPCYYVPHDATGEVDHLAQQALIGHELHVWGNPAAADLGPLVLAQRTDGRGELVELRPKVLHAEALADQQPGERARWHRTQAAERAARPGLAVELAEALPDMTDEMGLAELGHAGQSKDEWNAANNRAELARSGGGKAGKPSRPPAPPASGAGGHLWHLHNLQNEGLAPATVPVGGYAPAT